MKRILLAGESWMKHTIHVKGFDSFITSESEEGAAWLLEAFRQGGHEVTFLPNHQAPERFPATGEELGRYDAVFLSDIGSNTLLLAPDTFNRSRPTPDRCAALRDWVLEGGSLCMVGGYMSFSGIDAKARYGATALAEVLPVECLTTDDRVEIPQGTVPTVRMPHHAVFQGMDGEWPFFLGYNRTLPREGSEVLASVGEDPFVALRVCGKGRTAAFASDCAPHWGPEGFVTWRHYPTFWNNLVRWMTA